MTELWNTKTAEFLPQLKATISLEQYQRLQQIYWQAIESSAIAEAEVIEALGIAGEQKQHIEAVLNHYRELKNAQLQPTPQPVGNADPREVLAKLTTEQNEKVMALLTKDQLKKFATLKGKEFDTKQLMNVERLFRRPTR